MHDILNPTQLIHEFGYIGIFITLFIESGIIFGFFLPGDSLLFAAGLLAANHSLSLPALIATAIVAAVLGNNAGYFTGLKAGPALFDKPKSRWLSPERAHEAQVFFQTEGAQSLILARFIPAIRTFVPIVAGIAAMPYRTFILFNAIGAVLWGALVPILGFTLGKTVKNIDHYLLPIVLGVILLSMLPVYFRYRKSIRGSKVDA